MDDLSRNKNSQFPNGVFTVAVFILFLVSVIFISGAIRKNGSYDKFTMAKVLVTATPALPPIPTGMPSTFGFGLFDGSQSSITGPTNVPFDYRYQYLAGDWQSYGTCYIPNYIKTSVNNNRRTGFVYYRIITIGGGSEFDNLQSTTIMAQYYSEFKAFMQRIYSPPQTCFGTSPTPTPVNNQKIIVIFEPDLNGVMMQDAYSRTPRYDASSQPTSVASSGFTDVQGFPNTYRGFYQAIAHLRDVYAPNVILAEQFGTWGESNQYGQIDLTTCLYRNDCNNTTDVTSHANSWAQYINSFGPGYDLLAFDPLDRDAAFYNTNCTQSSPTCRWWWDDDSREPRFSTFKRWLGLIVSGTNKRVIMWQVPNGNRVFRSENNVVSHYQDNRTEYFLNPTPGTTSGRQRIQDWADIGLIGIMWGAGTGSQTHYFDYLADGITNPTALTNGNPMNRVNDQTATFADDDGGYIRLWAGNYYTQGALPLPGGIPPTPTIPLTNTPTPTPTYTPARVDINRDGIVNAVDFNIYRNQQGSTCSQIIQPPAPTPTIPCADIICDGVIGISEFNMIKQEYGHVFPTPNLERYCDGSLPNIPTPTP